MKSPTPVIEEVKVTLVGPVVLMAGKPPFISETTTELYDWWLAKTGLGPTRIDSPQVLEPLDGHAGQRVRRLLDSKPGPPEKGVERGPGGATSGTTAPSRAAATRSPRTSTAR